MGEGRTGKRWEELGRVGREVMWRFDGGDYLMQYASQAIRYAKFQSFRVVGRPPHRVSMPTRNLSSTLKGRLSASGRACAVLSHSSTSHSSIHIPSIGIRLDHDASTWHVPCLSSSPALLHKPSSSNEDHSRATRLSSAHMLQFQTSSYLIYLALNPANASGLCRPPKL